MILNVIAQRKRGKLYYEACETPNGQVQLRLRRIQLSIARAPSAQPSAGNSVRLVEMPNRVRHPKSLDIRLHLLLNIYEKDIRRKLEKSEL